MEQSQRPKIEQYDGFYPSLVVFAITQAQGRDDYGPTPATAGQLAGSA